MKAIEIRSQSDNFGHVKIDLPINQRNSMVRIIILVDEPVAENEDEKMWLQAISANPAFDFLAAPQEDVYLITDGEPFND